MMLTTNWPSSIELLGRFFSIIFTVAFVMALAYFATRWIAGSKYVRKGSSNLRLIEGVNVGYQSNVQLLQAGNKFILIGVTKEQITYIAEIPGEQIVEMDNERLSFDKYLKSVIGKSDDAQ